MAGKTLETIIRLSGDLDKGIQKALDGVTKNIDQMEAAARKATGAAGELAGKIADKSTVLEAAKKKYASYLLAGEKNSKQAKALKKSIEQLNDELEQDKRRLAAAEKAADKLAPSLDDVGDGAKDAGEGFTVMKGALSNLVSGGISKLADMVGNAASSLYGLADSTQEYREDMGKLKTAWESAGRSTELATATYKEFYSVLGEEDRSVEAVNHLAKFVETEQDMQKWTDICTGVWGTFGDSLPIEGLTEAANETAKVGKLTGVLADALNWAGVDEEKFQKSLDKCNSEAKRTELITKTLNGLYGEAADKYRENNESIIAARKANSEYTDNLAVLGEKIEPITTKVREGFNRVLDKVLELVEDVDLDAFGEKIDAAFDGFINNILPKIESAIAWISENKGLLTGIATAIGVVSAALVVLNTVLAIQSAIMAANPITWIIMGVVAAIGLLIAAGVALWKNWDTIKEYAAKIGEFLSGVWNNITTAVGGFLTGIKDGFINAFSSLVGIIKGPINAVIGLVNGAINAVNEIGFDIPDWVPLIGGKKFALNIPNIPLLAAGGFTNGVSIAGEAGTEAVISFDPAHREENLSYWARAGRMLGADLSDFILGGSGSGTSIDMGGVNFAPNIIVQGNADKQTIMQAIEDEYPEFIDMLEEYLMGRRASVYA